MIIRTISGKEFRVLWVGVAFNDILHFAVIDGDMNEIFSTFSDPDETGTLIRVYDGTETEFSGYSVFNGFNKEKTGNIVVSLAKEQK